jgi:hypothetical protein
VDGFRHRRRGLALALLVAVLAVFGLAAPASAAEPGTPPGAAATATADLSATTPAAPSTVHKHGTPDLPLAGADPAADVPPAPPGARTHATSGERPRAHRCPAADRAPPARPVTR